MSEREEHLADLLMKESWERATLEAMCRNLAWDLSMLSEDTNGYKVPPERFIDQARATVEAATNAALEEGECDDE